jgi:hypothetical protein
VLVPLRRAGLGIALAALTIAITSAPAQATSTTYYVDCSASSAGTGSQAGPWNTLTAVNAAAFGPGDQILFRRGTTCTGQFAPQGSGSAGAPIVADA